MASQIPPISTLIVFETAARQGSLSRAAKELGISQPGISHKVTQLEKLLSARLFERSHTGVSLTDAGQRFLDAVVPALAIIRSAAAEVADRPGGEQVVIGCTHDASHFILLPRYEALREALGEQVRIRILTYQYDMKNLPREPAVDVVLAWETSLAAEDHVEIYGEAVMPLCSPGFADTHAKILNGPISGWGELTLLEISRPNEGWATWEDWFSVAGRPKRPPRYIGLDNYAFVLEAAAAGHGIALGWQHFIERYVDAGTLVGLADRFIEFDNHYCGALTEKGRGNPAAHACLQFLQQCEGLRASVRDKERGPRRTR